MRERSSFSNEQKNMSKPPVAAYQRKLTFKGKTLYVPVFSDVDLQKKLKREVFLPFGVE